MKYKLLAVDMDGTLLNDDGVITERTKSTVLSAIEKGILFVPSTGRPMCAMEDINTFFSDDLPFIIFNGAMAVTGKTKKVLFSKGLGTDSVKKVFQMGTDRDLPVILWVGELLYVSRDNEAARAYQSISGAPMNIITDIDSLAEQGVTKMIWIAPPQDAVRYQNEMNRHFGGGVSCYTSRPYLLEFVDKGASKGLALEEIGKAYGIHRNEMIAVGDGYNDVSMLEYAGFGIAMQNAWPDIKSICRYVTKSNNDNGVAHVIDKFILSERN